MKTRAWIALCLTCAATPSCGGGETGPPDVVLIVLETEGEHADTPNLARFAADGLFYPAAFAHSPERGPALTALLSARTPLEAGVSGARPSGLPEIGAWLVEHGYREAEEPSGDGPFFLFANPSGTHAEVDAEVGRLLDGLREARRYETALIVLTSHRSEASTLRDADLRAPVVLKLPYGHALLPDFDRTRDKTVRHIDVVPTVLDVLGLPELPGATGTSLLEGTLRVLMAQKTAGGAALCLRDDTYKLVYRADTGDFEMYDHTADPGEATDVFAESGDERANWKRALVKSGERLAEVGSE